MNGRILIIAGSDPSGGAGIQADIKTVTALGGYAMTAITAVTVQNTLGVSAVHQVPPEIIAGQIEAVLDDIGADVIKVGMIGDIATAEVILQALTAHPEIPVVLDPVLVATSGDDLSDGTVADFLRDNLLPLASVVTPNRPEAARLTGAPVESVDAAKAAARALYELGAKAVLLKGGHATGRTVEDLLVWDDGEELFTSTRLDTPNTHGTGCTLASALATSLAQGMEIEPATRAALNYVHEAIRTAPGFGKGHGPLNHCHLLAPEE